MDVSQIILEGIKKIAAQAKDIDVGYYLGRSFVVIQANPVPVIATIVVVALAIFAYKFYNNPAKPQKTTPDIKIKFEEVNPIPAQNPEEPKLQLDPLSASTIQRNLFMSVRIQGNDAQREVTAHDLCQSVRVVEAQAQANEVSKGTIETVADALNTHIGGKLTAIQEAAKNMHLALEFANKHGTGVASASFSIIFGLGQIFSGALPMGVLGVGAGVAELIKIKNSYNTNFEIDKVFNDLRGNFSIINDLSLQNQNTLNKIDNHLTSAANEIYKISGVLDTIENITARGNSELVLLRAKSKELYKIAHEKHEQGIALLNISKNKTTNAKNSFDFCWDDINKLSELGGKPLNQEDAKDVISAFCIMAERLKNSFDTGMRNFNDSQNDLEAGLNLLHESEKLNYDVRLNMEIMDRIQQNAFNEIRVEAANRVAIEALGHAHIEIGDLVEQIRVAEEKVIDQVKLGLDNADEAKKVLEAQVNKQLICAGIAATIAAVIAGPIAAGFAAATAPKLIEQGAKYFTPLTDLLTDYELPLLPGDVKMGFYTKSTGHFHFLKGASRTCGIVSIHVGDSVKDYHFNLNQKDNGLNLANLANDLLEACNRKVITPDECLKILNQLAKISCNGQGFQMVPLGTIDMHFKAIDQIAEKKVGESKDLSISLIMSNMIESEAK
jgi:hypothetical protein